jgi:hypothetical protein
MESQLYPNVTPSLMGPSIAQLSVPSTYPYLALIMLKGRRFRLADRRIGPTSLVLRKFLRRSRGPWHVKTIWAVTEITASKRIFTQASIHSTAVERFYTYAGPE